MNRKDLPKYGILTEPDLGRCPSCKRDTALPRGMDLNELQTCPMCGAYSYGYKWLADGGRSANARMDKLATKMQEFEDVVDKETEVRVQEIK